MIHVSGSCNHALHATGFYHLCADTIAFMQLMQSTVCQDFSNIKFVIPHGEDAVPFHWGHFRGMADMLKLPPLDELLMDNVCFDTCAYHQPSIDPKTEYYFDDTKRYIDNSKLNNEDKAQIFEHNIRHVYPRLNK